MGRWIGLAIDEEVYQQLVRFVPVNGTALVDVGLVKSETRCLLNLLRVFLPSPQFGGKLGMIGTDLFR